MVAKKLKKIDSPLPKIPTSELLEVTPSEIAKIKLSCESAGLSIDNYVTAILDALSANKITRDKDGCEFSEPDHDKRLKAALIGLELEGYIKNKNVTTDNSKHTNVIYSWNPVQVVEAASFNRT